MNAVTPYIPSAPIAPSQALVPTTMTEAIKLAELMAGARLVPAGLQKSPADCLMVIQQAVRWQMDPFAVAQECSVIQGKLMYSGKLVAAVVNARGNLEERLSFSYDGAGDARTITVSGRMPGEQTPRTVTVALKDARTNAQVWKTQPDQQLMYHGTRVWARRHAPELVLGVWAPEEFDEATVTKVAPVSEASPVQPATVEPPPPHDPTTGEVGPRALPLPEAGTDWQRYIAWGGQYIAACSAATTLAELDLWGTKNYAALMEIKDKAPKIFDRIGPNVAAARAKLVEAAAAAKAPQPKTKAKGRKKAPAPEQPEEYLDYLSTTLEACQTPEELTKVWEEQFQPALGDMFPPDAECAKERFIALLVGLQEREPVE
jgi:hypothetical protein